MKARILFLCTGNYYRSRFAEIYFNWLAESKELPYRAESRGLQLTAANAGPISRDTLRELQRMGVDPIASERLPIGATKADFEAAERIIALDEEEHLPMIEQAYPDWLERVEYWQVQDVHLADPADALPKIRWEVEALVNELVVDRRETR